MKKIFTLIAGVLVTMNVMAATYTGLLGVRINDAGAVQNNVNVNIEENADGTFSFTLKNFMLASGETTFPVGNIALENMSATTDQMGNKVIEFNDIITIEPGDDPSVEMWYGPLLGNVPLVLTVTFNNLQLQAHIDIDMRDSLEQMIYVDFLGNSTFEPAKTGKPCDVNSDGVVDVTDVSLVIDAVLGN